MKKLLIFIGILVGVPFCIHAQNEMYFFSSSKNKENSEKSTLTKKQKETPEKPRVQTADDQVRHFYVPSAGSTKVVHESELSRDALDEYNRRGQVLIAGDDEYGYIPPTQDGEWLNRGYEGSMSDYQDAERIISTRDRRYAIDVNSPYYYDMVYGANSWDWNVYVDNRYAYVFPRQTNVMWSSWKFGRGSRFGMSFGYSGYYDPWYSSYYPGYGYGGGYYGGWGYPSYGWGGYSHWGGWYDPYYPSYGWGGGYYYGSSRRRGYRDNRRYDYGGSTRRESNYAGSSSSRPGSRYDRAGSTTRRVGSGVQSTRQRPGYNSGVTAGSSSVRPSVTTRPVESNGSTTTRRRNNKRTESFVAPGTRTSSQGTSSNSSFKYTRPSSTRNNSTRNSRVNGSSTRSNVNNSSSRSSYDNTTSRNRTSTFNSSSSTRSNSSYSSGSSSSSRSSSGSSTRSSGGSSTRGRR